MKPVRALGRTWMTLQSSLVCVWHTPVYTCTLACGHLYVWSKSCCTLICRVSHLAIYIQEVTFGI